MKGVVVRYGGITANDRASLYLDEGEIVVLMGPNGAGKSTALKALFGLAPIESGEVRWHEKTVRPNPLTMTKMGIAFVSQGRRVFTSLTVKENLEMGAINLNDKQEIAVKIEEVYKIFPILKTKAKQNAWQLSGGQQQMVAIGRALMSDPKVLLLDEPSLGLSPKMVKEMFEKIKEINARHQTAIMVVEHNIKSVLKIAHRVYVLDKGAVVYASHGHNFNEQILEKVFLGEME